MTKITDTNPEAESIQIALYRDAPISKRIGLLRSLSQTVIQLSRRAIREAQAGKDETEIRLAILCQ